MKRHVLAADVVEAWCPIRDQMKFSGNFQENLM